MDSLTQIFLTNLAQQIVAFEEDHDNSSDFLVGALITIGDTVCEFNGKRFEVHAEGTGCALVRDGKVGTAYPYQKESVGLMESTEMTWKQQFEIGSPLTFGEDGE